MKIFPKFKNAHFMYYISLVYLIFPIYGVLFGNIPWHILPMTVLFGICYLALLVVEKPLVINILWSYLCSYIVVVSTLYHYYSIAMYVFYLSNLLTWHFQKEKKISFRSVTFYLVLSCLLIGATSTREVDAQIFLSIVVLVCIVMTYGMQKIVKQEQLKAALNEKNASINLLLAENERNRIGQDLHDTLGHVFAMMSIKSELALTLIEHGDYERARKEVQDLRDVAKNSMQEVRQIVQAVKQHSLAEELQILGNMLELAEIDWTIEGQEVEISGDQETALSMALRELCNNLVKHSQASSCRIELSEKGGWVQILVEDNGIGFERLTGSELHSIRDRLRRHQGRVDIVSVRQPTQIRLEIPKGEKDEDIGR